VGPLPARIADAGVAIDLATHDLDVMQYVLGRNISRVFAEGTRFTHPRDRKSTRLNSSHDQISYAVFCLKKKKIEKKISIIYYNRSITQ